MSNSVPISQLNIYPGTPVASDFIPVVQSSSFTTFHTSIQSLQALTVTNSISASYLNGYGTGSFSGSFTGVHTGSLFGTSSRAVSSSYSLSSSYAPILFISGTIGTGSTYPITSSRAISASWSPFVPVTQSLYATSSLFSSQSVFATSASWASSSISASYGLSASYALTAAFVQNGSTGFIYPYIQSITFSASCDDYINFNFQGIQFPMNGSGYNYISQQGMNYIPNMKVFAIPNSNLGGSDDNGYSTCSIVYNPTGFYYAAAHGPTIAGAAAAAHFLYGGLPSQEIMWWVDNRGGSNWNMYFSPASQVVIKIATSPTTVATHTYTPLSHNTYTSSMRIIAGLYAQPQGCIYDDVMLQRGIILYPLGFPVIT